MNIIFAAEKKMLWLVVYFEGDREDPQNWTTGEL